MFPIDIYEETLTLISKSRAAELKELDEEPLLIRPIMIYHKLNSQVPNLAATINYMVSKYAAIEGDVFYWIDKKDRSLLKLFVW